MVGGRPSRAAASKIPNYQDYPSEEEDDEVIKATKKTSSKKTSSKSSAKRITLSPAPNASSQNEQKYTNGTSITKVMYDKEREEHRPYAGRVISHDDSNNKYTIEYDSEDIESETVTEKELRGMIDTGGSGKIQSKQQGDNDTSDSEDDASVDGGMGSRKKHKRSNSATTKGGVNLKIYYDLEATGKKTDEDKIFQIAARSSRKSSEDFYGKSIIFMFFILICC